MTFVTSAEYLVRKRRCSSLWLAAALFVFAVACAPNPSLAHGALRQGMSHGFALSGAQFWTPRWAPLPDIGLVGDVEGTHRADLLAVSGNEGGEIRLIRTSSVGKPQKAAQVFSGFGAKPVAAACGRFVSRGAEAILVVLQTGHVRLVYGIETNVEGKPHFAHNDLVAMIPTSQMPAAPIEAVVSDFDGDGLPDVLLVGSDGHAIVLRNWSARSDNGANFPVVPVTGQIPSHRQIVAGRLADSPDSRARLFYLTDEGAIFRSVLSFSENGKFARLQPSYPVASGIGPGSKMVAGYFRGDSGIDLIVGQFLFPGGDPAAKVRLLTVSGKEAQDDSYWVAADIDGNGKEDLVCAGEGARIHFSFDPDHDPAAGYYASTNDGLPDIWKIGLIKPGGIDLRALGCRVGHRDLIAEILPMADVPPAKLRKDLEGAAAYYASMPISNPDGTKGIAIHFILRDAIPVSERDYRKWDDPSPFWETIWPKYVLRSHSGVVHYVGIQKGSGGASGGFKGWCGVDQWQVFVHEMGHQLTLGHEGGDGLQPMAAVYLSLMNYSYGYASLRNSDGSRSPIGYSSGTLCPLGKLNEEHLSEILPLPQEAVEFLAGPPYHFHLMPGKTHNTTLIDWNGNGIFGETDVRADLTYAYGVELDPWFEIGISLCSPVVVTQRSGDTKAERLLLFTERPSNSKIPGARQLLCRLWLGSDRDREGERWSLPGILAEGDITGDPSVISVGERTIVAFPTTAGVKICTVAIKGADRITASEPVLLPGSAGAQVAVTTSSGSGNKVAVFLWRGPNVPLGVRVLPASLEPTSVGSIGDTTLSFISQVPVAVAAGAQNGSAQSVWIACMPAEAATSAGRHFEARCLSFTEEGERTILREGSVRPIRGGYAAKRPTLLWEAEPGFGEGRLYLLASSARRPDVEDSGGEYCALQTAYPEENGGWQLHRYGARSSILISESAVGACWFQGNMVYALRQAATKAGKNNVVRLSFRGTGATPQPVGDYDDIRHIVNSGLRASLQTVEQP